MAKIPIPNAGGLGLIPGQGTRSHMPQLRARVASNKEKSLYVYIVGEGYGNLLQYSCLEDPLDRGAFRATVYRVVKSQTQLKLLSTYACQQRSI